VFPKGSAQSSRNPDSGLLWRGLLRNGTKAPIERLTTPSRRSRTPNLVGEPAP
jgi:hypothetical protein